ncbi:uracil-DNA glycosylase [Paraburkholderia caballeronis]|uniref:Type-4 uracil-DNA glycosylase n=1 Tax=Paraburkholderia caballeronis TaxID=416943 RepID=A0A1H7NAF6_9BURK|nr:uracil-DNA glycosylase [Paraburkholderia caballeronis]PXW26187.1 DNA polymerase [Paraburkholderia caballeronis]PXX01734.1 DNA polymerase [Paraburkholderia caballeronis]RAK00891.1 DNA polymerase [Paraburkholderia caballeronis]SEC09497.1 DNA polymerase [Paraburkholderia caballeronis]SEL20616.1 DNA polymerase [Paraburkholderia caballeronis]
MPLNEIALEELGLAPRWVRRGVRADDAQPVAAESAVDIGNERTASVAAASGDASTPAAGADARATTPRRVQQDADRRDADIAASERAAEAANREPVAAEGVIPTPPRARPAAPTAPSRPPAADEPPPDDDFAWFDSAPAADVPPFPDDVPASAPTIARNGIATLDWDALAERVASCTACRLCERRTNTVFGVGDREAEWMLIGEAPGENEDRQGEPFVGQAGKLLDNMLRALSLARGDNVYIANVIKCRPPGNRNPEPDEVARCEPYLQRQVALVKPKIIVALGRFAAQSLLKTDGSIASLRGRVHQYEGVPVIVTYHPAYLLRSLHDKSKAWTDLCLARDTWRAAASGHGG